jgi:large subunit ribosomal protein L1
MQRSKTYRSAAETFDKDELYSPLEAIKLAKSGSKKKFDETVDVVMRLGVDPRKADQMVRGTVNLPHGTGKTARVLVFANAEKADAAREAGADVVGGARTFWPATGPTAGPFRISTSASASSKPMSAQSP